MDVSAKNASDPIKVAYATTCFKAILAELCGTECSMCLQNVEREEILYVSL